MFCCINNLEERLMILIISHYWILGIKKTEWRNSLVFSIGKNYSHPDRYNSTADQNYSSQLSVFPTSNICMEELMGGKV